MAGSAFSTYAGCLVSSVSFLYLGPYDAVSSCCGLRKRSTLHPVFVAPHNVYRYSPRDNGLIREELPKFQSVLTAGLSWQRFGWTMVKEVPLVPSQPGDRAFAGGFINKLWVFACKSIEKTDRRRCY